MPASGQDESGSERDVVTRRLRHLAWLLDSSIPLPGLGFRIGLDALIGLVPGLGDIVGTLLSGYIVAEAARIGAPRALLMRMAVNVGVEAVVGAVPVLGDLFDAGWKANQRNVALLGVFLAQPVREQRASKAFVWALLAALLGVVVAICALIWLVVHSFAS